MMKVAHLMTEYFQPAEDNDPSISNKFFGVPRNSMPISPEKITWEIERDPQRLVKDFKFKKAKHLQYFINEILEYEESINHHAKIKIDYRTVRLEVNTHTVEAITEIDREFAETADMIYEDVLFYES